MDYHKASERDRNRELARTKPHNKGTVRARFVKKDDKWLVDIPKNSDDNWRPVPNRTIYVRRRDGKHVHVILKECVNRNEYATHWTFVKGYNNRKGIIKGP
jgi:hypothetical protein